jgi:hypothetical protein
MNRNMSRVVLFVFLLATMGAVAQQSPAGATSAGNSPAPVRGAATVRGCLDGSRGNYIVIEDQSSMIYVLKGVGNKLDNQLHREVEVKGRMLSGTIKTGVREEKLGSNPSDTVHGVDGIPLQVADPATDVRTIAKHCKAADQG